MVIRPEQMEVLEKASQANFEDAVVEEMRERFPKHCELLGDENLRRKVREGLETARGYGLASKRGLCLFVQLGFQLGAAFDLDPQYPWAAEILNDRAPSEPVRGERLEKKASECLAAISGPNGKFVYAALGRLRQESLEHLAGMGSRLWMTWLYPEKCRYIGEEALDKLVYASEEAARSYGLTTPGGVTVYVALAFFLGCGFDADPQFAFAQRILADEALADPAAKAAQLHQASLAYLENWAG